jgi:5'-nucleotidase
MLLKAFEHNIYLVASTRDRGGTGGILLHTTERNLTADTEFGEFLSSLITYSSFLADKTIGIAKYGGPSIGTSTDLVSVCAGGLGNVLPNWSEFWLQSRPFLGTLFGTIRATNTALERGIPAIAY